MVVPEYSQIHCRDWQIRVATGFHFMWIPLRERHAGNTPMLARFLAALLLCGHLGSAPAYSAEIVRNDDRGRQLLLPVAAQRIVTLAPFLTELVFAVGAGDRLV